MLDGCDAVINAAGGVKEPNQYKVFLKATQAIVDVMREKGIKRIVSINGVKTFLPGEQVDFKRKIIVPIIRLFSDGKMEEAKNAELKILIATKDIEWISVRAGQIVNDIGTGLIAANDKQIPGRKIMLSDLAKFIVNQTSNNEWVRRGPMVATRNA